jgi:hypothetical protein
LFGYKEVGSNKKMKMENIAKESFNDIKDTVVETTKKVSETINTRIKNPFVFSYLVSLILINWKPISIFFKSELNIYHIIKSIEKNEYEYDPYKAYLYPLFIALAYTFVLPFIEGFRSLILDLAENLKLYSTTIQIKNFQKKQKLEIEKSDLVKRNSLSSTIITLEGKNTELKNKLEIQTIKNQTSKIEVDGLIKQKKNFEKIQLEDKSIIEQLTKDINNSKVSINTNDNNYRNLKNLNYELKIENKNLHQEYSLLKSNFKDLEKNYITIEKKKGINEFVIDKINKQKLISEYQEFRKTEVFELFIEFATNRRISTSFTNEALDLLVNKGLIDEEKYSMTSKVKYRLTDKGIFFIDEYHKKK